MRTLLAVSTAAVLLAARPSTQALQPFSAEDMLKVATAQVLDFSEDGRRVALSVRRLQENTQTDHRRFNDPSYVAPSMVDVLVVDTRTAATDRPFKTLMNVRQASWSRDGAKLALLTTAEDSERLPVTTAWVYDAARRSLQQVPRKAGAEIAANSELAWSADGASLIVATRSPAEDRAAQAAFRALVDGPIIVQSSRPFLDWDEMTRRGRTRSVTALDPATGAATTLVPSGRITSYQVSRDGSFTTWLEDSTEKTNYDVIGGTDNALRMLARGGSAITIAEAKTLKTTNPRWSDDGRLFAYAEKGEVFVQRVDEAKPRSLTPKPKKEEAAPTREAGAAEEDSESFSLGPFNRDATRLVLTSRKGWYVATVADGARERILALDDKDEEKNPRLTVVDWTPSGDALLVQYGERASWDRGLMKLDLRTKQLTPLVRDRNLYQGFRQSRDGGTVLFQRSDGDRPADWFAADAGLDNVRRLTDLNPWMAQKAVPASELVSYRDTDGKMLYGVLRYPVGYEKGKRYATVFEIYETFFDNGFNARAAFLANHGYAVFHPSVNLVVGRPGESWAKGVTSAANRLIDMGIADPDRLGVHGTSYGGYATVLLLTETDRFKAAINVSGKVNMISFYTDSPRIGVRNTHAPEKSQDRIGGTLWEYPERYIEHSAIFRADRIKTPLLNITGDQDWNVPPSQSREIYYALRRLGKETEWVRYANGGHRPPNSVSESIDFEQRILAWYDKYLKKADASQTTQPQQ
jgi:dipeptidyl aminopeptidase/acylaminoacyl peptidase